MKPREHIPQPGDNLPIPERDFIELREVDGGVEWYYDGPMPRQIELAAASCQECDEPVEALSPTAHKIHAVHRLTVTFHFTDGTTQTNNLWTP